jgi:hypothetical protein
MGGCECATSLRRTVIVEYCSRAASTWCWRQASIKRWRAPHYNGLVASLSLARSAGVCAGLAVSCCDAVGLGTLPSGPSRCLAKVLAPLSRRKRTRSGCAGAAGVA